MRTTHDINFSSLSSANFGVDVVDKLPDDIETGIYFGWATVDNDIVHKMVMSIGWNPFYENKQKSMVRKYLFCEIIHHENDYT